MTTLNEFVQVDFKYKNATAYLKLYGNCAQIVDYDSEDRPKFMLSVHHCILTDDPDFSCKVSNGYALSSVQWDNELCTYLTLKGKLVLIDGPSMYDAELLYKLFQTDNLFIIIGRAESLLGVVPTTNRYRLKAVGDWFAFENI